MPLNNAPTVAPAAPSALVSKIEKRGDVQDLNAMQLALRQLLIGFAIAISLLTVFVLIQHSVEMPPRPKLNATAEVQSIYREQREEANEDAKGEFELVGGGFLIPTFTALLGYFVGNKQEHKSGD